MEKEEIKRLINWLQGRVHLGESGDVEISFDEPLYDDFLEAGFDREMINSTLGSSWWPEMAADIRETPGFVERDEEPQNILQYARDVVHEYVSKRIL
jgi:hypothetical protein